MAAADAWNVAKPCPCAALSNVARIQETTRDMWSGGALDFPNDTGCAPHRARLRGTPRMPLGEALSTVGPAFALGVIDGLGLVRLIARMLYGVSASDPALCVAWRWAWG